MKEKIKKILFIIAEIGIIFWAVRGMFTHYVQCPGFEVINYALGEKRTSCEYHISPVLAYFLSAILILYLLRKHEPKN